MSALDDLLGIIRDVVADFQDVKGELTETSKILVTEKVASEPLAIEDNNLVIYAGNEQGEALKWAVFEQAESLTKKGERAVEVEFGGLIHATEPYSEPLADDTAMLEKLRPMVPHYDILIIRDALIIRRIFKARKSVSKHKQLLYDQYGPRGINISNLISEGYYESYIIPTYEQLVEKEGDDAKDIFSDIYEEAVTRYPFAVFVGASRNLESVKEEIVRKIGHNLQENQHVLNIHGIGSHNVTTVLESINDPEITRHYVSEPDITKLKMTISVKLYF